MLDSVFQHGVASGDPLQDRVILWTRLTLADQEDQQLAWAIAADPQFRNVVGSGIAVACAENDFTVHVDATGLQPGRRYYYRFHALGETSPVGRTKTLGGPNVSHIRFAQASCARFDAGYFNAYARIADRDDLDFLLHLGNYIYETAGTPPEGPEGSLADIGRAFSPPHECKTLQDYRARYYQYHRDPDVQRMHATLPILAAVDDHELATGAWRGGAGLHNESVDGPWGERMRNALRARYEWLPIRLPDPSDVLRLHHSLHFGRLADLLLINTRTHRDQPLPPPEMHDPNRTGLGLAQRQWLFDEFSRSSAAWRILANPTMLGTTWKKDLPESVGLPLLKTGLIAADGTRPDYDQWDGYPAERYLLLRKIRDHQLGNTLVLSGDIQVGLAQELKMEPANAAQKAVAVECVNASITSPNLDDRMKWEPRTRSLEYEQELTDCFPEIRYIDLDSHGYNVVDVTPERVLVEWWYVESILQRTDKQRRGAAFMIESGTPALIPVQ